MEVYQGITDTKACFFISPVFIRLIVGCVTYPIFLAIALSLNPAAINSTTIVCMSINQVYTVPYFFNAVLYIVMDRYNTDMNNRDKTPAHTPGDTPVAKTLARLMLADPDIDGSPSKLADEINSTVLLNSTLKTNQPTISRILKGEIRAPKHPVLGPIAEFFGVPIDLFYKENLTDSDVKSAVSGSKLKRLTKLFLDADDRGRDVILAIAKHESKSALNRTLGNSPLPNISTPTTKKSRKKK
jgi:hypothetical protein